MLFLGLVAIVLSAFLGYNLYLIWCGITGKLILKLLPFHRSVLKLANEAAKWDDVKYYIKRDKKIQFTKDLYEYNQSGGKSKLNIHSEKQNPKDESLRRRNQSKQDNSPEKEDDLVTVTSLKHVKNIYDRGFWNNLCETLFPESLC